MTKTDAAIEALRSLPAARREEVAELVLELTRAVSSPTALTEEQLAEVRHRRATFVKGDPTRIDALLARLV